MTWPPIRIGLLIRIGPLHHSASNRQRTLGRWARETYSFPMVNVGADAAGSDDDLSGATNRSSAAVVRNLTIAVAPGSAPFTTSSGGEVTLWAKLTRAPLRGASVVFAAATSFAASGGGGGGGGHSDATQRAAVVTWPSVLVFTADDYDIAQPVRVLGLDDGSGNYNDSRCAPAMPRRARIGPLTHYE